MRRILNYLVARLLLTIPMIFVLLTLVFVVLRVMPGDPVSAMLGGHAPEKVIQQKKQSSDSTSRSAPSTSTTSASSLASTSASR